MINKKSTLGNGEDISTAPRNFRLKICTASPKRHVDWYFFITFFRLYRKRKVLTGPSIKNWLLIYSR